MEDAKLIELNQNKKEIMDISKTAQALLSDRDIDVSDARGIPTIVFEFLRAAWEYLGKNKDENGAVEINLFGLLDMGVANQKLDDGEKEGNFAPYARPGQGAKLYIKDDGTTEEE